VFGTALTHLIGWPLIGLNYEQQHFEADFRFNLVRTRENAEQIALLRGESVERSQLLSRFQRVVDNWLGIMRRTMKLTAFTASYSQASVIFPYILVAPAYFADKVQLGGMMQTASAFSSVQDALSFFISAYRTLAPNGNRSSRVLTVVKLRLPMPRRWRRMPTSCRTQPPARGAIALESSWSSCPTARRW